MVGTPGIHHQQHMSFFLFNYPLMTKSATCVHNRTQVAELKHCDIVTNMRAIAIRTILQLTLVTHGHLLKDRLGATQGTYIPFVTHKSSLSLSSCVGAAHTCAGTCSHGPYGGYHMCLQIKTCCKCKSTRTYSCVGGMATSPLPSRGSPHGDKIRSGYITPAFSGSPWWGEIQMATSPLPPRGPHGGEGST